MNVQVMDSATPRALSSNALSFLVLRQDPDSREYRWLGVLSRRDEEYVFRYTPKAANDDALRPLPGFADRQVEYRSTGLFATFANRVMTPRRDSYRHFLNMIGLDQQLPDPFEVLARTWGTRATDRIQVLPVPRVDTNGQLLTRFLVHGGGYVDPDAQALRRLQPGDPLALVAEPGNANDPLAVLVCTPQTGVPDDRLGYVPRPLAPFVHALWAEGAGIKVVAENINLPEDELASNQMRLLARLEAVVKPDFDVMAALDPENGRADLD